MVAVSSIATNEQVVEFGLGVVVEVGPLGQFLHGEAVEVDVGDE